MSRRRSSARGRCPDHGQLLQGGRIVGTEPDGGGFKELQLVGDPIRLNGGGGVLGCCRLAGLGCGGFALGTLGSDGGLGGSLTGGLAGLATNVLGSTAWGPWSRRFRFRRSLEA